MSSEAGQRNKGNNTEYSGRCQIRCIAMGVQSIWYDGVPRPDGMERHCAVVDPVQNLMEPWT